MLKHNENDVKALLSVMLGRRLRPLVIGHGLLDTYQFTRIYQMPET